MYAFTVYFFFCTLNCNDNNSNVTVCCKYVTDMSFIVRKNCKRNFIDWELAGKIFK